MKINVSWEKLKLFYMIAKHKNITSAANHLNISQPSLSRVIIFLEKRLKVTLFHRHPRGLTLTEKGLILYHTVEKMMNNIEMAETTLLEMGQEPKGSLIIGSSAGIISHLLLNDAKSFLDLYPELNITVVLSDSTPDFSIGGIEAAVYPYIPDQEHFLAQEYLMSVYLKLYASKSYINKNGMPQTPKDLDHHHLIAYGTHHHPFGNMDWHLSLGCPEGVIRKPYIQVNLGEKIRSLTKQGIGITTLAAINDAKNTNIDETLVQILPDIKGPQIDFYYIYPKHLQDSLRIKVLGDHFKSVIKKQKS